MSEAGPVLYDTVELRRRIAGAFSAGELRALAESLGVGGVNWDRGLQEAAREVVRQCERYAGLPALIARLREERPLVEWPEPAAAPQPLAQTVAMAEAPALPGPQPPAGSEGGDAAGAPARAAQIPVTRAYPAMPTLAASPGSFGPPQPAGTLTVPGGALADPYAPPPPAAPIAAPAASTAPAAPPAPPRTAGWPGMAVEPAPAARSGGIDPRIFVVVAGLMVVAAVIAYVAGRASTATADRESAPAASASAPARAGRGDGPTAVATEAFFRSFANLARVCELPSSAGTGVQVFQRVFERCGPVQQQQRRPRPTTAAPPVEPSAEPAPAPGADPAAPRPRRPNRSGDPAPNTPPAPARGGCLGVCEAQHGGCRAHCGAEPTESGAYDGYQRCLGQCLRDASRCRLSCR